LTEAEIKELNELIEPSSKTEEASLPKPEAPKRRNEFIKETIKIQEKRRLYKDKSCKHNLQLLF
jgi:23S rRNA pseudouridine2604 synthase